MKHVLKVSHHLKTPSEARNSSPIWISDAILRETFDRFSRGCRRHGSHVPGPLEARRRAAKRKNASIACAGASLAPLDAAGLFGTQKQGEWWRRPQAVHGPTTILNSRQSESFDSVRSEYEKPNALGAIFSWFGNPPPPPVPPAELHGKWSETVRHIIISKSELKARKLLFQEELQNALTLEDIRLLVQQHRQQLDSSQALVFSTLALQHILESNWSLADIKEFVLDPILRPRDSKPFRVLTNALKDEWLDRSCRTGLFDVMCQLISLGIASPEEMTHIIRKIPSFKMPKESGLVRLGEKPIIHDYYQRFLLAMEESKVISIEDLGYTTMWRWFKDISDRPFTPAAAHLQWELRSYSARSQKDLASHLLSQLVTLGLQYDAVSVQETDIAKFLAVLPIAILPHVLMETTQSVVLLPSHQTEAGDHRLILRWHDVLANLSNQKVKHILFWKESWSKCLSKPGTMTQRAQRVVIASWVVITLSKKMQQAEEHLRKLDLRKIFKEVYSDSCRGGTRDALAQFLETLQSLPLPHTKLLMRRLRFVTDDYLVVHNEDFILRHAETGLLWRFSILQNDRDYDLFRNQFNDALVDLAESVNNDLSLFLHVSRHFIEKDETAFRIIVRILKHNLAFHSALSQSWPERIAHRRAELGAPDELTAEQEYFDAEVDQHSSSTGNAARRNTTLVLRQRFSRQRRLDPRQVLDLMNHLAISFATSPIITPRQAVRRVYWCFQTLHRYGAPIESPITRALWHAGITRQGRNGTAKTILMWIVQQIRIVEGDCVANNLLRSAGFRERIEAQFDNLKQLDFNQPLGDADGNVLGALQKHELLDQGLAMLSPKEHIASRLEKPFETLGEDVVSTTLKFKPVLRPNQIRHTRWVYGRKTNTTCQKAKAAPTAKDDIVSKRIYGRKEKATPRQEKPQARERMISPSGACSRSNNDGQTSVRAVP